MGSGDAEGAAVITVARYHGTVMTSWFAGLALLAIMPLQVIAQAQRREPPPPSGVTGEFAWRAARVTWQPTASDSAHQLRADRSAARTVAVHTAVGAGAGLFIGLVLSGATVGDDKTAVVLTWTALGAATGVVSGVVTWLAGRH